MGLRRGRFCAYSGVWRRLRLSTSGGGGRYREKVGGHRGLDAGELRAVLGNFDLVSLDPDPVPGSTEYLHTVEDFTRSLTASGE